MNYGKWIRDKNVKDINKTVPMLYNLETYNIYIKIQGTTKWVKPLRVVWQYIYIWSCMSENKTL